MSARVSNILGATHARLCALLILLSLACFLPGFVSLQPMDRDEPRFAQATKQMLETGDVIDIRFQDEARYKKPIGIYWLQGVVVSLAQAAGVPQARTTIALYRIPSLLGALATVLLTYWAALAFVSRPAAFLAAAFMATSILLIVEAHLAKTDAVLAACCVAAMGGLARAYLSRREPRMAQSTLVGFWLALGVGILVKGPVILMIVGLCALVLSRREKSGRWLMSLRPLWGSLAVLVLVLPWLIAIGIKTNGEFFSASLGDDMLAKVGSGQEKHWGPPGFYLLTFFGTFWPGAVFAAIAGTFAWRKRGEDGVAFALAWILPSWAVFEAVPTKLPHYVLPLYPAIAILTIMALMRGQIGPHRPGATASGVLLPLIPACLCIGLAFVGWKFEGVVPALGLAVLSASTAMALLAWRAFAKGQVGRSVFLSLAASPLLVLGALDLAQTQLAALKISPRLAEVAQSLPCSSSRIGSLGYREPSLIFLGGTGLELLETEAQAAAFLSPASCSVVFVEKRFEPGFLAQAQVPLLVTRVKGFNINSGRWVDMGAYIPGR